LSTSESSSQERQINRLVSSGTLFEQRFFKLKQVAWHSDFILRFGNQLPANFAWLYIDLYNRTMQQSESLSAATQTLKLVQAFQEHSRADFMSTMTLKNFDYMLSNTNSGTKTVSTTSDLFSAGHREFHLVALALSLYSDVSLIVGFIKLINFNLTDSMLRL
jgi:hypothetical protein